VEEFLEIPQNFIALLDIEFQSRLRVKWSGKQQAYLIQQKIGPNLVGSVPRGKLDAEKVNDLAQGYLTIMTVSPSEKMKCQECSSSLSVPNRETRQIRCLYCKVRGRSTQVIAGYYPLDSNLIAHLKTIDPMRNMETDQVSRMNDHNENLQKAQLKELANEAESYADDNLAKLMGIPEFKYAGNKIKEGTELTGF